MILGSLKKFKKRSPEELKLRSEDTRRTSGNTTRNDPFPPFLIMKLKPGCVTWLFTIILLYQPSPVKIVISYKSTTSTTKTKAAQYDLPGIEDIVPNIWSPVKVAYDKYTLWVTHVKVMRKHGYGYLEEIVVRRADNNQLINLSGDDVTDFAIKINVTKPDTTRPDLKKRHMYTPYKDPQGFIYVDDYKRNRLMRSDKLYKFSDGSLTRLLSSLKDITKNIDMEYLPKRRWSTLENKRAHFMIRTSTSC
ncbi:hypothetical protein Tco_0906232 [Tanacetum coccineum]